MIAIPPKRYPKNINGYKPGRDRKGYRYDPDAAEKAAGFFRDALVHVESSMAGEALELAEWQEDVIRTLFGWMDRSGKRRYRTCMWFVPRKNGKTTIAAGIANLMLFCDGEAGSQCYCAAHNREQSSLLFRIAAMQIRANQTLAGACKIRTSVRRIIYGDNFLHALPANEAGGHGLNQHFGVYDELHLWVGNKHRECYESLHTSTANRSQPIELITTTAGYDTDTICHEVYKYAKAVQRGEIRDATFLPVMYEAGENDDWTKEKTWRKANPNLNVSVPIEYLRRECEKAQRQPSLENVFRRLHLNQWTSQESRWLSMIDWRKCDTTTGDIADGATVFGGLDLASTTDVAAWMLAEKTEQGWRLRGHYFIPRGRQKHIEMSDHVPYSRWAQHGYVTITPTDTIDYEYIHRRILNDADRYDLLAAGYDPWNAEATRVHLENEGITMIKMRQGVATLSEPCKELERCVIERQLDHGNDPVLAWMAENVEVKTDENGNIRPVKPKHGASGKKIDGIVAAIMAIGVGQITEPQMASVFDSGWEIE